MIPAFFVRQYSKFIPSTRVVGILGSVGKTTTTLACKTVLQEKMDVIATTDDQKQPSLATPMSNLSTLLKVRPNIQKAIVEMGIDSLTDMNFYLNVIRPQTIIVARISSGVNEQFSKAENLLEEVAKAIKDIPGQGWVILNWDDPQVRKLADKTEAQVLFFGSDRQNCHVWIGNVKNTNFQTTFELNYGVERIEVKSQLLGSHQIYPLVAAASLAVSLGFSLTTIKKGLEKVPVLEHQLQALSGYNGSIILDDSLNIDPQSLDGALNTLNNISARRRILVLSEIKGMGVYSEEIYKQVARKIFKDKIDLVFLGTGETKYYLDELLKLGFIEERIEANLQNPVIVSKLLKVLGKGDVVLIKGNRNSRFDEIVKKIAVKA